MLSDFFAKIIKQHFDYTPTESQEKLINILGNFVRGENDTQLLLIKGFAGTGKTTVISAFVKALEQLKLKSILLAPTGRAAKVISSYSKKPAYTIHKKIYRQKSLKEAFSKFLLDKNLHSETFFIVDEASMISNESNDASIFGSGKLLDDLIEYVYTGKKCKLILVGDTAQLPPVGISISPALDRAELTNYNLELIEVFLPEVVRQSLDSGILFNATQIRNLIDNRIFAGRFPKLTLKNYCDIEKINGAELIEKISECYDKFGREETMIVTRSNKQANKYNAGIRKSILYREEEISTGDLLMIVKNNYHWLKKDECADFIANGDIAEIVKIFNYEERYEKRFVDIRIRLIDFDDTEIDAKVMLDTLTIETASLNEEENRKLFYAVSEDYTEIDNRKKRNEAVREDAFFNALQIKFAYSVTCHKAQGGQWKAIFVDQGWITEDRVDVEYLRWLYTAITRSTEKLYLVNFKDDFFEN